jgi:hypothetical protein
MTSIEQLHFDLHDVYLNIYKIYYETESGGFFSKIFGKKKAISEDAKKLAKEYFTTMENISKELVAEINKMERRIVATSDKEFEAI